MEISTERRLFLFKDPAGSPERNDIEDLASRKQPRHIWLFTAPSCLLVGWCSSHPGERFRMSYSVNHGADDGQEDKEDDEDNSDRNVALSHVDIGPQDRTTLYSKLSFSIEINSWGARRLRIPLLRNL